MNEAHGQRDQVQEVDDLSHEVPVPALQLRWKLMKALLEIAREFTLGKVVFEPASTETRLSASLKDVC